jgi:hypothetical protein
MWFTTKRLTINIAMQTCLITFAKTQNLTLRPLALSCNCSKRNAFALSYTLALLLIIDDLTVASHCLHQEASALDHEDRQNNNICIDICTVSQSQARWNKILDIANVRQRNAVVAVKV